MVWSPPSAGQYKVNVDASDDYDSANAGIGIAFRNLEGRLVDGYGASFPSLSPLAAEGIALSITCDLIKSRNYFPCSIEIHSLQQASLISSCISLMPWEVESCVFDVRSFLVSNYLAKVVQ